MAPKDARPLVATYRLQLSPEFTFAAAAETVPYLAALGVSHLYLSPIWECVPGSAHGYDVVDHASVRAEIGGMAGFLQLRERASAHGLGIVVDIVPNHVGILGGHNRWWQDVLRFGEASSFAPYFDIDWDTRPGLPSGIVLVPVLGRPFGEALESGELALTYDGDEITVRYFAETFPLAPSTYHLALGTPPPSLVSALAETAAYASLVELLQALESAPPDEATAALARLSRLATNEPAIRSWIDGRLAGFSGTPGMPETWDGFEALLSLQHYRLAYWRVSADEINYRRFFDINDLAAIRQEYRACFDDTHSLLARMVSEGLVDGIRVDHIDGLYDPGAYLGQLSGLVPQRPVPVWVEKILAADEDLPRWPVAGTTGYDFLAVADGVFVAPEAEDPLTRIYREFTGETDSFGDVAAAARLEVAEESFAGEVSVLATQLFRLAQRDRRFRDITHRAFRDALEALLASFPVYRTYLEGDEPGKHDRKLIEGAARDALARGPHTAPEAMWFLVSVLLLDADRARETELPLWRHFRRGFQQISSPIMAKGVEDTSFFRFTRLLTLNEVGAHPSHFPSGPGDFHAWAMRQANVHPLSLSATSTHDTKRSEDARMRLAVLSEDPAGWRREVRAWARLNNRHRTDGTWPDASAEYYFYQSLIATLDGGITPAYVERVASHMLKAMREAAVRTSWTEPNAGYEKALNQFVHAILDPARSPRFVSRLRTFVGRIEPAARLNSLSLLTLKCLAPGVPDIYQGCELPFFALTDPDNRRPVDFAAAQDALPLVLSPNPPGCCAKPWLLHRLLELRAELPGLFAAGDYEPLEVTGGSAANVFAFARTAGADAVVVAVPRLVAAQMGPNGFPALQEDTKLRLPRGYRWHDALAGSAARRSGTLGVMAQFTRFPVAVLRGVRT